MRRTKIVATLGPATDSPELLDGIIAAGVDVIRLNAAHAGPSDLDTSLVAVRESAVRVGREVGVLLDLPGPKIRVGDVTEGTVLEAGHAFRLLAEECVGDAEHACITHQSLASDVHQGDSILLDDGRIELKVLGSIPGEVQTEVVTGGPLLSNKGVNVPGVTLSVSPITRYDRAVLEWALVNEIDWIGQSFVRSAHDVEELRRYMTARVIPIVAKIEKHEATTEIDAIVAAADAVMVARGDLAVETSPERVPVLQRQIVASARALGKPVIIATEMLDSMREHPRPTRAEASDVATAIFGRADAVMLSGETAVGQYPVEAVATMARIAVTAEEASPPARPIRGGCDVDDVQAAMSAGVAELGADVELAAIVPLTQSGATAFAVSRHRPETPIIAATPFKTTVRLLTLAWGVKSVIFSFSEDTGVLLDHAATAVREAGYAQPGERIAITAGLATRTPGGTDLIHVRNV